MKKRRLSFVTEARNNLRLPHSSYLTVRNDGKFPSFGELRGGLLAVCFLAFGFSAAASDTIRFTWQAGTTQKEFYIASVNGEAFTIHWDDGADSTYTGKGSGGANYVTMRHTYGTAGTYNVVVAATASCHFAYLELMYVDLISVDVSNCAFLEALSCGENYSSFPTHKRQSVIPNVVRNLLKNLGSRQKNKKNNKIFKKLHFVLKKIVPLQTLEKCF
jgi:hypothetical protein